MVNVRTKAIVVLALAAGLTGSFHARGDDVCIPYPMPAKLEAPEAEQRKVALQTARAALCAVEQARDRKNVEHAVADSEFWTAQTDLWKDYITLIESRSRFPVRVTSRAAERRRQNLRDIARQFAVYSNLGAEMWMMRQYPNSQGPGDGTTHKLLLDQGLDPKSEFERIAREVRQPPISPWFIVGKVELVDHGVNEERIRAERAYLDAERNARSIAKIVADEKDRFAKSEMQDQLRRSALVDAIDKERDAATRTITNEKRLKRQLEVIDRDLERRMSSLSESLWRDHRPLKQAREDADKAESEVQATAKELARIKRLQRVRLSTLKSDQFSGTWRQPGSLADFQSDLDRINDSIAAAKAAMISANETWEDVRKSWGLALAESEAAANAFSPYLQAIAQSIPHAADQIFDVVKSARGGPGAAALKLGYGAWMNTQYPQTVYDAKLLVALGDDSTRSKQLAASIGKGLLDTAPAQAGRRLADGYLQKQISSGALNGHQLQAVAKQLANERKAFNDLKLENGFKAFSKSITKELMQGILKGVVVDNVNRLIAQMIDGSAAQALFEANVKLQAADGLSRISSQLVDAAEKELADLGKIRHDMLVGESDAFATSFKIEKNDAFFAESGFTFTLSADPASASALRQSSQSFSARLGNVPLHRGRRSDGSDGGEWLVSFEITPEAEASIARLRDLEALSLKIIVDAK